MNRLHAQRAVGRAVRGVLRACSARRKRPLIYAGGGVIHSGGAAGAARVRASSFGIPVVTTLMGLGAFDTTHPLSMRMLGMHGAAFANYAVDDCDFLFALGARFDDRVAGNPPKFAPNARRIAQIDIDASEINKVKPVQLAVTSACCRKRCARCCAYGRRSGFKRDWSALARALRRAAARRTR